MPGFLTGVLVWVCACVDTSAGLNTAVEHVQEVPAPSDAEPVEHLEWRLGTPPPDRAWTAAGNPPSAGRELFREGTIHQIALTLSDAALQHLRDQPYSYVEGRLDWGGTHQVVGVRTKGSASFRTIDEKPSFKIDVNRSVRGQRLDGFEHLTLNNMVQDPTMLHEHTYYALAHRMGVPAPRHAYALVTVNGAPYGLYSLVETMDEQLVARLFPDAPDGNLYEASGADYTWDRDWFELEESGGAYSSPADVDSLVDAVEAGRLDAIDSVLRARFDRDEVLTHLAIDIATGNSDGYVFNRHNYLTYHSPGCDCWSILPWGTDRAFTAVAGPQGDLEDPLVGVLAIACQVDPVCAAELDDRLHDVLQEWHELEEDADDARDLIEAACQADPRREKRCDPGELQSFLRDRPDQLFPSL